VFFAAILWRNKAAYKRRRVCCFSATIRIGAGDVNNTSRPGAHQSSSRPANPTTLHLTFSDSSAAHAGLSDCRGRVIRPAGRPAPRRGTIAPGSARLGPARPGPARLGDNIGAGVGEWTLCAVIETVVGRRRSIN